MRSIHFMKPGRKIWAISLGIVALFAMGVFVWDQRNREWFDSAGPSAELLPKEPAQVTNGVVVAIGSFDFPEANNPFPEFPDELAQYLEAKADSRVTFVQRTPGGESTPTSGDAWVLNGSYGMAPGARWSAALHLERVRGGIISLNVEGEKGNDLNEKIAASIITAVTTPSTNLITLAGKRQEFLLHEERGLALVKLVDPLTLGMGNPDAVVFQNRDDAERRKFRLQQAVRSFESAIALDPKNNRARLFVAQCYLSSFMREPKKARALLTGIIDSGVADRITTSARIQLGRSWEREDPAMALEFYKQASAVSTNGMENVLVKSRIAAMRRYLNLPDEENFDEKKRKAIASLDDFVARMQKTNRTAVYFSMLHPYDSITNAAERAAKSLAFVEELKPKYAPYTPYVLLDLVRVSDPEPAIQAAFGKLIAELKTNPSQVADPKNFFDRTWDRETISLFDSNEDLAMEALQLKEAVAATGLCDPLSDQMHVAKGVYLMHRQKLAEAIEAFEKVGARMVQMNSEGPWGCGSCPCGKCPVSAIALAERCQKLRGLPSKKPGFHIELEKGVFHSKYERPILTSDGESIWLGDSSQLQQFHVNGEKVAEHRFRAPKYASALASVGNKLYVGTMGGGLLEVDKTNFETKARRATDGLLSDHICGLKVISNQLWIGYGHRTDLNPFALEPEGRPEFGRQSRGGIGYLDLMSGTITNFVRPGEVPPDNPSIWENKNNYGDWAPSLPTLAIEDGRDGSIYMAIYLRGLQRFDPATGKWSAARFAAYSPISSVAASSEFLCVGQRAGETITVPPEHAIWIRPVGVTDFKFFSMKDGLPNNDVGALLLDGKTLWVGGFGYVAELKLDEMKIVRVITVPGRDVTKILKAGDNLWVATENHVFHAKL